MNGSASASPLALLVRAAFRAAWRGESRLDPRVLALPGMSGSKYRRFINTLIGSLPDARYLEVGLWQGSTICAAINGNRVRAVGIDDWSLFGGPKLACIDALAQFRTEQADVAVIEQDFRGVDYAAIGRFNVYLFDGPHGLQDHYDGVRLALPALDDAFVLIVDDWNWAAVRRGTLKALADLGLALIYDIRLRTSLDNAQPEVAGTESDWHNGYLIAVVAKTGQGSALDPQGVAAP